MTNLPMTNDQSTKDQAPVFSSWNVWYGLTLGVFAVVVGLMVWFSKAFR